MGYFYSPYHEIALGLALVLITISAPPHFRARNTGTILYIFWIFTTNLIFLINRIIWHDHVRNVAPIWCDITAHLLVAIHYGIEAAGVVLNRRLYKISRISSVVSTPAQQRKELIIELSIGLGIPVIGVGLHYIVQGHRGDIIQGIGCWSTTYRSIPAILVYNMWPCILSLIAIVYGILSIRYFLRRRNTVEEFLNSHSSGLNADRYFRLMCFSAVELTIAFPLTLHNLLGASLNNVLRPWKSWEDVHSNYNRFDQIPAIFFETDNALQFALIIWAFPLLAFVFFLFFGLGQEQANRYKGWFYTLLKPFGIKPPAPKPYNSDHRTWWQKLLRRPASSNGTGLTSSRGPTDSLPAFRHDASNIGTYPEKPIPSARSRIPHTASLDASLAFDFDDKLDTESDISAKYHSDHPQPEGMLDAHVDMNKALSMGPSIVVTSLTAREDNRGDHGDGDSDGEKDAPQMRSLPSTSSTSSRRVSAVIRDVELSETEVRAMEARVQQIA